MLDDDEAARLRSRCTRFLTGHGPVRVSEQLATIPADTDIDRYGDGGAVTLLEQELVSLLGFPAAVFFPSGTMAQQSVLRIHAERRGRRTVLAHPMCHLFQHEEQALERVQALIGRPVGSVDRLLTADQLGTVAEPPAALVVELPQRDLGGAQPEWDDLQAQLAWARDRGAAAHLDGARLWESAAGYGREPAAVAAGFDSAYVSFYKGIGALPGCCVATSEETAAELREWRRRMGGTLFGMWPAAASARTLLARRLPRMSAYLDHTRKIAAALAGVDRVTVLPDPPQTPMLHALIAAEPEVVAEGVRRLASDRQLWTYQRWMQTPDPAVQRVELPVGDATLELTPGEVAGAFAALAGAAV